MLIRPEIDALPPYNPGIRPDAELRRLGVTDVIQMNLNEGPWPPFPDAIEAMQRELAGLNRYPDQGYSRLVEALSETCDVPRDQIVVGNGSGSILRLMRDVVLREGDEVLMGWPAYPQYPLTAGIAGAEIVRVPLRGSAIDLRAAIELVTDKTRLVFLANPHNPTGGLVPRDELEWYFQQVPAQVATVLDEAYFEFIDEPDYPDTRRFLNSGKPLLGLRTFSKVYGLAGLRIGFGFATPELAAALNRVRETFVASSLAAVAALASLPRQDLVRERVQIVVHERRMLADACAELGIDCLPSQANFVFIDLHRDSREVNTGLLKRGILVRPGAMHDRPAFIRVTIGLPEENRRFIGALREVLAEMPESEPSAYHRLANADHR
jgi:histidinol-phosphate aminotransferase